MESTDQGSTDVVPSVQLTYVKPNIVSGEPNVNLNVFFDKIFIINLDASQDRLRKLQNNLLDHHIYNVERQPGVRLPRMSLHEIKQRIPKAMYRHFEAYGGQKSQDPDYILNCIGTNLAHYQIIQKSKQRGYTRILILEDDAYFVKSRMPLWKPVIRRVLCHHDWHIAYFGYKKTSSFFQPGASRTPMHRIYKYIRGGFGYALHAQAFDTILNNYLFDGMELDVFYEKVLCRHGVALCSIPEFIGHRDKLESTITYQSWKSR